MGSNAIVPLEHSGKVTLIEKTGLQCRFNQRHIRLSQHGQNFLESASRQILSGRASKKVPKTSRKVYRVHSNRLCGSGNPKRLGTPIVQEFFGAF